jgi:hypothetical protein
MIPERIGTIGNTQGVNARSRPAPKKVAITIHILAVPINSASFACSETGGVRSLMAASAETVVAVGRVTLSVRVVGG